MGMAAERVIPSALLFFCLKILGLLLILDALDAPSFQRFVYLCNIT